MVASYRPRPGEVPTDPGVYRFRDRDGRVIYVGKARNLRQRLSSYFQDVAALHPRTATMVRTGASVEWTVVGTEVEALQLEYAWIKEFDPRFNVRYRDDKSYPYLAVTMGEEFPRAQVMRGAKRKGTRYFGPYAHAWAIRETLDLALRVFPVRTCSAGVFRRAAQVGRPCLLGYIDKCSAPCVGRVDAVRHREIAEDFCDFMAGETGRFMTRLTAEMKDAAAELDFERAARLRDDIGALERVLEKSAVVLPDATDADVFGLAEDELEVAVQLFHVRGGRMRGQRGWVAERDAESTPEVVEHLLQQVYGGGGADAVPREVLVPVVPDDADALADWLSGIRGSRVDVRVPRRGDKRALMETVARNATQSLARHKVTRAGDLTTRSQALQQLHDMLGLDEAPLRIECFDISHVMGTQVVGSMVVFEDGLPRKSEYRRFVVRGDERGATDDTAAMHEVLTRRFRRGIREEESERDRASASVDGVVDGDGSRPPRFAYRPGLVVVDGGLPQVNAAARALEEVGVVDVPVVGLAKRLEEVWLPGEQHPVVLPRTSEGLYLLQRVRDEAHRFAVTFHRQRRSAAMTSSRLDGIPGLGDKRQKALLAAFGSVKRIRAARAEELAAVPGIGPALARVVAAELGATDPATPAVDLTTGEVLDEEGAGA
ncbi:MAG: excinuclease ABC subunit UvrC [Dermatophilaceae bacterium]